MSEVDLGEREGLFGPTSVTWRVHADPVLGVAGLRALFLQALHPRAMAGVAAHSRFREDPWGRLLRTAEHVGVTTYGTSAQARIAGRRVRGVHRTLVFADPDGEGPVRVDNPALLLWVHCVEVESFLSTVRRAGLRLSDADADRYLTEQRRSAELVGLDPAAVPADRAALRAYFDSLRPTLRATPAARQAASVVAWPPLPRAVELLTPARPAWLALAGLAFALLPRWARRRYGLPGLPTTDLAATVSLMALRSALLAVPPAVREGPHLKAARARLS